MQIPIVNGCYTDMQANFRTSYPRNMVPVPKQTGIADGYLRVMDGVTQFSPPLNIQGAHRGGINWNGTLYRVVGSKLVQYAADGTSTVVADVGNDGVQASLDYSYDYLAIASAGKLYYYNPAGVSTVTSASVVAGGGGYAVNDQIELVQGVWLRVSAVSAGAITALTVAQPGISLTAVTPLNPQAQLLTTGGGTGATVNLTWSPAPNNIVQVTTPALGTAYDMLWIAGYFAVTDGTQFVVTNLNAPAYVDPLKNQTPNDDPGTIRGLLKYRNELYVFSRYMTSVWDNVGGANFPFTENLGALIEKGALSKTTKCKFAQQIAFLGSGRDEPTSIYMLEPGVALKIATAEIEELLRGYTEDQLAAAILEPREDRFHQHLFLHLPDQTLVYDRAASLVMQQPIWFVLSTSASTYGAYRPRNFVWCYNKWTVGDVLDSRVGYFDRTVATTYGQLVGWQFDVPFIYNEHRGFVVRILELIGTTGRAPIGSTPMISVSYTRDGLTYSHERFRSLGLIGDYNKRLQWLNVLFARNFATLRFRGVTAALCSFTRLEAEIDPLNK